MLNYGAEVLDRNHNVKLVFNINVIELLGLDGD
jgi:hypothetical protein